MLKNKVDLDISKYVDAFDLRDSENLGAGLLVSEQSWGPRAELTGSRSSFQTPSVVVFSLWLPSSGEGSGC